MKWLLVFTIKLYQKTISPDHGIMKYKYPYGYCRFYPSCSQYSIEALQEYGIIKGVALSVKRIIKCNPWQKPTIDKITKN